TSPVSVIRPIAPEGSPSVNHKLLSGPTAIPDGEEPGTANALTSPLGVILPISCVFGPSVNQKLPSGPWVIPSFPGPPPPQTAGVSKYVNRSSQTPTALQIREYGQWSKSTALVTAEQVPTRELSAQLWQGPAHASSQHTWSTQNPDAHCDACPQG